MRLDEHVASRAVLLPRVVLDMEHQPRERRDELHAAVVIGHQMMAVVVRALDRIRIVELVPDATPALLAKVGVHAYLEAGARAAARIQQLERMRHRRF